LKRLDSAKEIQAFPLIFFGRALLDSASIWVNLASAWIFLAPRRAPQAERKAVEHSGRRA
jgi:hypothetical protein